MMNKTKQILLLAAKFENLVVYAATGSMMDPIEAALNDKLDKDVKDIVQKVSDKIWYKTEKTLGNFNVLSALEYAIDSKGNVKATVSFSGSPKTLIDEVTKKLAAKYSRSATSILSKAVNKDKETYKNQSGKEKWLSMEGSV